MYTWASLIIIFLVIMWSVWLRICRCRVLPGNVPQVELRPSPFSLAVQELIATSGGVYLSLVMVVSFLKIELPETIAINMLSFDPLAMTAVGVAVIQPVIGKLFGNR